MPLGMPQVHWGAFINIMHQHQRPSGAPSGVSIFTFRTPFLMHADRDMRIHLDRRAAQVRQNNVVSEFSGATTDLHDDRAIGGICRFHDRQHLFHVVDVECGQSVVIPCSVIEQLL